MQSIGPECNELKKTYEACFNQWFSEKFLKGEKEDTCAPIFKVYQDCVKKALKEKGMHLPEMDESVLDTDKEKQIPSAETSS